MSKQRLGVKTKVGGNENKQRKGHWPGRGGGEAGWLAGWLGRYTLPTLRRKNTSDIGRGDLPFKAYTRMDLTVYFNYFHLLLKGIQSCNSCDKRESLLGVRRVGIGWAGTREIGAKGVPSATRDLETVYAVKERQVDKYKWENGKINFKGVFE